MAEWFRDILVCPQCTAPISVAEKPHCTACDFVGPSPKDLRMQKDRSVDMRLPRLFGRSPVELLESIDTSRPAITYAGPSAQRDSRELMSEVSKRLPAGGKVLDLGCGPRDQALPLQFLGFEYVGVDYSNPAADFLADAHSLPFKSSSFDCVFSYAVLEHLHNPFIAFDEVRRVLKPGGWFIGTVSQGEPFHGSYFHHTPWALLSLARTVPEMNFVRLWDSVDTLAALASMGRYPRVIKSMIATVDKINSAFPWLAPRRMKWSEKKKQIDSLYRAGSVCFAFQRVCAD